MQDRNISGILIIDKPQGVTSHDMVGLCRKLYGTRKVGHAGTLDPMATGVLVMLIGRAAKASDFLLEKVKTYEATLRFGIATDTQDVTGTVTAASSLAPTREALNAALPAFRGDILQIPPMYSALKRDGQKLYDLARRGIEIEREARPVTIHRLEVTDFRAGDALPSPDAVGAPADGIGGLTEVDLTVTCSKGTYIRTLCHDLGERVGCYGTMSALRRTQAGAFTLERAVPPDALRQMSEAERDALLLPIEDAFADLPAVKLQPFFAKLAHSGQQIYQKKIGTALHEGTMVRFFDADGFFALGEVRTYEDGSAIKPIKQF
ncbi:MAG: tRNA pseudouridine(55) synthase TruB [Clostridia bacterium]|nr:tRNA pseudouridine(55) synthase TruB [Clostridia bacterium]